MKRIAIVTGASRGIGREIAKMLAKKDIQVIANYNNSEKKAIELQEKLKKENINIDIFKADISKREDARKLVEYTLEKYKKIDILVNNAGISEYKMFTEETDSDWNRVINNNLYSAFVMCQEVIPNMIHNKNGNIINNVIHTVTRYSEDESKSIDQEKLLETSLTSNPDYICVGEMKGSESFSAQEAARTGHTVVTTTHANSCEATYARMVTLCKTKYDMNDKTLYNLVTEAFPIVVFIKKLEDNTRKVMEIKECIIHDNGDRELSTLFRYKIESQSVENGKTKIVGSFVKENNISKQTQKRLLENGIPLNELEKLLR